MTAEEIERGLIIPVDKPYGWTSFDVVNFLKYKLIRLTGNKKLKIGHAGTLDPLATGLLLVCTGKCTKQIEELQAQRKTYRGTILLGAITESYDLEKTVQKVTDDIPEVDVLHSLTDMFKGEIQQRPPAHSAVKIGGKRSYMLARKGSMHRPHAKTVTVHSFQLTKVYLPQMDFEVQCSKGTYIRSLAHDFGESAGTGGLLAALRRTASGDFEVGKSFKIKDLKIMLDNAY